MRDKITRNGILILLSLFLAFYLITNTYLSKYNPRNEAVKPEDTVIKQEDNYEEEIKIVNGLYNNVRMLYDVVNNKFKVSQSDTILVGDVTYKRITNFSSVVSSYFTDNGTKKYLQDLKTYFISYKDNYYLAGNLVSYQTYYFRGDTTNIYIISSGDTEIEAIIYEKWSSNNKNTLATIRVLKDNGVWLIDDITILSAS